MRRHPQLLVLLLTLSLTLLGPRSSMEEEPLAARPFFFALSVADVEASVDWYESVLGLRVVRSADLDARGIRIRLLRGEDIFLELIEDAAAVSLSELEPPLSDRYRLHGVFKIGLRVEDLAETEERLAALDVPLRGRVITEQDGSMRSLQVQDPDGNVLQVFEVLDD
jgi:catechol 2,3-dioxygenase-like lactoylglutathione lyase family enzyme